MDCEAMFTWAFSESTLWHIGCPKVNYPCVWSTEYVPCLFAVVAPAATVASPSRRRGHGGF